MDYGWEHVGNIHYQWRFTCSWETYFDRHGFAVFFNDGKSTTIGESTEGIFFVVTIWAVPPKKTREYHVHLSNQNWGLSV
jgi:hypothetical protein